MTTHAPSMPARAPAAPPRAPLNAVPPLRRAPSPLAALHAQRLLDAERGVLGAVLTGALRLADFERAPEDLCGHLRHRRVLDVLVSLLEMRADGWAVPGVPGLDWCFAERACGAACVWALGVVKIDPPELCGLSDLAHAAPRRGSALAALSLLVAAARVRSDRHAEHRRLVAALRDVLDEAAEGYLAAALREANEAGHAEIRTGHGHTVWIGADVLRTALARHRAGGGAVSAAAAELRRSDEERAS